MKSEQISRCHPRFLCVYSQIRWWYHFSSLIPHIIISSISSECPNVCAPFFFVYVWICFFNCWVMHERIIPNTTNTRFEHLLWNKFNEFLCTRVSNEKRGNRRTKKKCLYINVFEVPHLWVAIICFSARNYPVKKILIKAREKNTSN